MPVRKPITATVLVVGLLAGGALAATLPDLAATQDVRTVSMPAQPPNVENTAFLPGESLRFSLRYGWFKAGEATFSVDAQMPSVNNRETYHFVGKGRSTGTFDVFYTVRDEFETWVDPHAMLPYKYVRKVHEGNTRFTDNVYFDHKGGTIRGMKGQFQAAQHTRDMLSALYYARCLDLGSLEANKFYEIPTFLDDKIHRLGLRVLGRENVKIALGTFRCIRISPRVVSGTVFKEEDSMVIWVTDDKNYIPVKIYSPLVVGNVNAELTSYTGLRNPLTSKIK